MHLSHNIFLIKTIATSIRPLEQYSLTRQHAIEKPIEGQMVIIGRGYSKDVKLRASSDDFPEISQNNP